MDDMPAEERDYPPSVSKLSKTPSWIMLGFALGALCVLSLPQKSSEPAVPPRVERAAEPVAPTPPTVERGLFFESVFAEWSKYAVWENELTEVAFWNEKTKSFSDCFEVFRSGERYYFRSIPHFTRPELKHGVPKDSPLQFTETPATREEWLRENNAEKMRQFLEPPPGAAQPDPKKP
jgi:hypothetical protein